MILSHISDHSDGYRTAFVRESGETGILYVPAKLATGA
jgi:hypothetical protein